MIKIVKGSYGMRVGKSRLIRAVQAGDDPIELPKEQEERLVRLGVAVYVGTEAAEKTEKKAKKKQAEVTAESDSTAEAEFPELEAAEPVE